MIMDERPNRLEPLKTLHETRANDQYVEALVFEIPAKLASRTLGIVKPVIAEAAKQPQLHHLRRIIHLPHLPPDLLARRTVITRPGFPCCFLIQVADQSLAESMIVTLQAAIDADHTLKDYTHVPRCFPIIVPLHAPLDEKQAKEWGTKYWPCIFNPAAQLLQDAPPLHLLRKTKAELESYHSDCFMRLAELVAAESRKSGRGLSVGAVVVDPTSQEVVAVAGDARFYPDEDSHRARHHGGRPEFHALMRAISMVANRELRKRLAAGSHQKFASSCVEGLPGQPLSAIEQYYSDHNSLDDVDGTVFVDFPTRHSLTKGEGYLCSNLDIYLTHEPCVCCGMAMVHSRFRACVLLNRMANTGSLTARTHLSSLGYGLFWRRELNWRVLTFKYNQNGLTRLIDDEDANKKATPPDGAGVGDAVLEDMFHA